jgi:ABC-2 type transport system permease protein
VSSFGGALQSEVTKITSTRLWWILAIIMAAYIAVCAGGAAALFGALGDSTNGPSISGEMLAPLVYSFGPVLVAKLVALIGAGALYGVIAMIAAVGAGAGLLLAFGIDPQLGDPDTWALIGRSILAMALWSAIGVGLGVLVPSQVAAIVIVLAFTQFVEPILRLASSIADWTAQIGQFLPGAASDSLVGASFFSLAGGAGGPTLDWWQGGLVLLAIAVVVSVLGWLTTWRRDVT